MKDNPLISVIIPVYNVEKYLPQCIESVINQSYQSLEIILVNDGSTDSSLSICLYYQDLDQKIKVIDKKNEGVGAARNDGISIAKGTYIYFLDSDDFIEKDTFQQLSSYFQKEPDIIQFGFKRVNETGVYLNQVIPPSLYIEELPNHKESLAKVLRSGAGLAVWDKLIKRSIIKDNELLFDNKKRGEDFTFVINLFSKAKSLLCVPNAFVNYRILLGRQHKFDERLIENHVVNFEKLKNLLDVSGKEAHGYLNEIFRLWFFRVIPLHISGNKSLSLSQKTSLFHLMFQNQPLVDFIQQQGQNLGFLDTILKISFLKNRSLVFLSYGKLIKLVRTFKYK